MYYRSEYRALSPRSRAGASGNTSQRDTNRLNLRAPPTVIHAVSVPPPTFAEFFAAHVRPLRRTAYGLVGDWDRAEELTQATFVRLYPHWANIASGNPRAYARRVMVNLFLDERRRAREVPTEQLPEVGTGGTDGLSADAAARLDLGRTLAGLPRQMRAVVVLRFLEDRPVAEVADLLGIAEGTVKSHTHRALAVLHELLATPATGGER